MEWRPRIAYAGGVRRWLAVTLWFLASACGGDAAGTDETSTATATAGTGGSTGGSTAGTTAGTAGTAGTTTGTTAGTAGGGEFVALVLPVDWQQVPAPDDPLALHRPAEVSCPLGAWLYEPQGLEINTAACNYAMFVQPSRAAIVPGARLRASLYHFDLNSEPPATAHVALMIEEAVLWEQEIAIPGKANAYTIDLVLDFTAAAGTPVYFHLHNHGQNTWTLGAIEVEVLPP